MTTTTIPAPPPALTEEQQLVRGPLGLGNLSSLPARLALSRPLVVLDCEATGPAPDVDRLLELAVLKIHPDGKVTRWAQRFNPGEPIPRESTAVHGVRDEDVAGCPPFSEMAAKVAAGLSGCDLCGHNIKRFDGRLLAAEFRRAGIDWTPGAMVDTQKIHHKIEPRDLGAAVGRFLGAEAAAAHAAVAHGAAADVEATAAVLAAQLEQHPELPGTVAELVAWHTDAGRYVDADEKFTWRHGEPAFAFGKYKGSGLREVVKDRAGRRYLEQFVLQGDFTGETKELIREAFEGRYPVPPAPPSEVP